MAKRKKSRWSGTSIAPAGEAAASLLAPFVRSWLDLVFNARPEFPEELAQLATEVVRKVAEEMDLYRKYRAFANKKHNRRNRA